MLARSAAELEGAWNLCRDLQSCLSVVKLSARLLWQSHWDNLDVHTIKPILGEWASSNRPIRQEEVVLPRLRMGCTKDSLRRIPSREFYLGGKVMAPLWPLKELDREWNPFFVSQGMAILFCLIFRPPFLILVVFIHSHTHS